MDKKTNKIAKILVPIIILCVILGIWFVKNSVNKKEADLPISDNPDFELVTTTLDLEKLKSYGIPIMIDFGSDSCIPCKEMAKVLEEVNSEYKGKVIVKFVDVWKYESLAEGFPIEVIPTQFFYTADGNAFIPEDAESMQMYTVEGTDGNTYTEHIGVMTKDQIVAVFKEMGVE